MPEIDIDIDKSLKEKMTVKVADEPCEKCNQSVSEAERILVQYADSQAWRHPYDCTPGA